MRLTKAEINMRRLLRAMHSQTDQTKLAQVEVLKGVRLVDAQKPKEGLAANVSEDRIIASTGIRKRAELNARSEKNSDNRSKHEWSASSNVKLHPTKQEHIEKHRRLRAVSKGFISATKPKALHLRQFADSAKSRRASFGFREVPEEEKDKLVGDVFRSVASNYDLMNDIMSGGLHRLWKDRLVSKLRPFPGMQHLDVAGGTGDVAFRVVDAIHSLERMDILGKVSDIEVDDGTRVYVCDINPAMLNVGKQRAQERGLGKAQSLVWVEGDAEALAFKDESFDGYTIAFGIRNVTHIDKVLNEAYRVLRRGGHFMCLELSHVENPLFKQLYDIYSFSIIPSIGELVAGDRNSYQYLVESIRKFPRQEDFARMVQGAGFQNVEYENLVGGVVAIHSGFKL